MKYKNELHGRQPDTVVVTSVGTLKSAIKQWTAEQIKEWAAKEKDVMLDEAIVLKRLGKSRATLWRWNASGYLVCHKIGGKNCYKQSDVERIEKGLK